MVFCMATHKPVGRASTQPSLAEEHNDEAKLDCIHLFAAYLGNKKHYSGGPDNLG
jgi:hypothetical protein